MRRKALPLTPELRAGRRALEGVLGSELIEDWRWDNDLECWRLMLRLKPGIIATEYVPASTEWHVLVDKIYPEGKIDFYPAANASLTATFPHQGCNLKLARERGKLSGKLCLDVPLKVLGRRVFENEPRTASDRLKWHVERALDWLRLASTGALAPAGEPFEIPEFLTSRTDQLMVAFAEGPDSLTRWREHPMSCGIVKLFHYRSRPDVYVVDRYLGDRNKPIVVNVWGGDIRTRAIGTVNAIWITLPKLPVLPPWQAPVTWGELRQALRVQHIELDQILTELFATNILERHSLLLFGFPIPRRWGDEEDRYHWLALQIPVLHASAKPVSGFRPDKWRAWQHNQARVFKDDAKIDWIDSQNWAPDELGSRGVMGVNIRSMQICLFGAGAVGSVVAELLVRAGCHQLTVFDPDRLSAGNLVRHTLRLDNTLEFKAQALARRLNAISPHAKVDYVNSSFPPATATGQSLLKAADLIVDCTGSDDTIHQMGNFDWSGRKCFASLSVGVHATRLFVFAARSENFPVNMFHARVDPWLKREREDLKDGDDIPREGIGCWHPVFPARADDIWLMASIAVKALLPFLQRDTEELLFNVYEQTQDSENFAGVVLK